MALDDDYHASDSLQIGEYRYANLLYKGSTPVAEVDSYMRERMPQHAWSLIEEKPGPDGAQILRFKRGRYWADCQLSRASSRTTMQIVVRTDIAPK